MVLSALGMYGMAWSFSATRSHRSDATYVHFGLAYGVMTAINIVFLVAIILVSVGLFRLNMSAVTAYWILMAGLVVYGLVNSGLWLVRDPTISVSIGAATGIGNMGIAPFVLFPMLNTELVVPDLYPLVSMVALILTRKRYFRTSQQRR